MLIELTAACVLAVSQTDAIPTKTLYAVQRIEGGRIGAVTPNFSKTTGRLLSQDLGPFQINTTWLRTFTIYWGQDSYETTYTMLRDNGCAGAYAAGAILRYYLQKSNNLDQAIALYHTGPKGSAREAATYLSRYHAAIGAFE